MRFSETVDFTGCAVDVTDRAGGMCSSEMETMLRKSSDMACFGQCGSWRVSSDGKMRIFASYLQPSEPDSAVH